MPYSPWAPLTEDIIKGYLSGEELDAFRHLAKAPGDDDPVAGLIVAVTNFVRAYVLTCPRYKLGPDGTLPVILHDPACHVLIMRIMNRVHGVVIDPEGQRRAAYKDALALLEKVSQGGGPSIPLPDGELGSERRAPGLVPIAYSPPTQFGQTQAREFGRQQQDGL